MTRSTNARVGGIAFLVYIAAGLTGVVLSDRATGGVGIAARLAAVAQHQTDISIYVLLALVMSLSALVIGVTLYAITREQDPDLAMLGLVCRVCEGVIVGLSIEGTLSLLWLATATGVEAPEPGAARALAAYLLRGEVALTASFFAVGSTAFSYLFLRGRIIPVALAWLGVIASALLVVVLPLQLARFLGPPVTSLAWVPMLVFEVVLGLWLIIKGAAAPGR